MTIETEAAKTESGLGSLGGCLVEGSAEDKARGRRSKRRAIAISVTLQTLGMTALVIAPLLAKPAELTVRNVMPIPPYSHAPAQRTESPRPRPDLLRPHCSFCAPTHVPTTIAMRDTSATTTGTEDLNIPIGDGPLAERNGLIPAFDTRVQPKKPDEQEATKKRVVVGHIDPAQLTHRVEPIYPALARQIRRAGKVELHAIIATDGSIQSLEVVSGDPLFVQSALDAVRQWHYKPTYLNGQPVEIDTFITVIYTMPQ